LAGAFDAWVEALRFDPMRIGALKGIAFLYFRAGDVPAAIEHLQRAAEIDPDDASIVQAITRVRQGSPPEAKVQVTSENVGHQNGDVPQSRQQSADNGVRGSMLVDGTGLRLNGTVRSPGNEDVGDRVAAELAGVSKEAARTSRLLGLGTWQCIAVEMPGWNLFLVPPTPETLLLTIQESSLTMARLALISERAAREAREWLEQHA
jgi:predicted regulator of Ras-like GTPase activity (Roadblock/LC7/MglB family)